MVYIPKHDRFLMLEDWEKAAQNAKRPVPNTLKKEAGGMKHVLWSIDPNGWTFRRVPLKGLIPRRVEKSASTGLAYDPHSDLCFFRTGKPGRHPVVFFAFRYVPEKE